MVSHPSTHGTRKNPAFVCLSILFCCLAGVFLVAPAWAAPVPSVTLSASTTTPFIGNSMTVTATFDNTGAPGETGYGPFIDIIFPSRGADGPTNPDGISFGGSATYLGATVTTYSLPFGPSGCVTHPLAVDNTGAPVQVCGQEGDTLVVAVLPFGSFVTDQPPGPVVFTANVSNLADVGTALNFRARGGFEFGADALNNPTLPDPTILSQASTDSTTWAPSQAVTPQVVTVDKTASSGPNGVNFPRVYTITIDIAPGQTIDGSGIPGGNIIVTDTLPSDIVYLGVTAAGGTVTDQPAIGNIVNPADNSLIITYPSLSGPGPYTITVDFYVPEADFSGNPNIPRNSADDQTNDPNEVRFQGTWTTPLDTRDTSIAIDTTINSVTRDDMSLVLDKSVSVDGGGAVIPGAILRHTLTITVSDYFAFQNLVIADTLEDGHRWYTDGTHTPNLTFTGHQGNLASAAMNGANYSVTGHYSGTGGSVNDGDGNPLDGTDGTTDIQFSVSEELKIRRGSTDGTVLGGCVPVGGTGGGPADCGAFSSTPPVVTLTYYTKIQEYFSDDFAPGNATVDQGDTLDNAATLTGDVLSVTDAATPTGLNEQDDAAASARIGTGSLEKYLYQINGMAPGPGASIKPGDLVTYRLVYNLPTTNFENLFFTDYLPLPVFDATTLTTFDSTVSDDSPAAGFWKFRSTTDTLYDFLVNNGLTLPDNGLTYPTLSTNGPQNTVTFTYGDFATDPSMVTVPPGGADSAKVIDLLFTVMVSDDPYANGLLLTNQASASESSSTGTATSTSAIHQIVLDEPLFTIDKKITDSSHNPGDIDANGNITNADAGDILTFTVTATNTGDAPAHDVTFREPAVAGLGSCAVTGVTVNGGAAPYSGDMFGAAPYLVLTNPVPVDGIVVVTYTCTLADTVTPRSTLTNTAYLNWAAGPGATKFGEIDDDATITIGSPAIDKIVSSISPGASSPDVAAGDVITYRLNVTVPEGTTPGLTIVDVMPAGFAFAGAGTVVVDATGFTGTLDTTPTIGYVGATRTLTLGFGDVIAIGTGAGPASFGVTYNVNVRNTAGGAGGTWLNRTNNVTLNFTGNPGLPLTDSHTVRYGEPILDITKLFTPNNNLEAGQTVTITLTVVNSGPVPAFDLAITDTLNEGASNALLDLTTIAEGTTPAGYTYSYADPTVTYTQADGVSLAPGGSVVFTFTGVVRDDVVTGSTYRNTARVDGDSQEGVVANQRADNDTSPNASAVVPRATVAKTNFATSEGWTTNPLVAIGEVISYRLTYTLPTGLTRSGAPAIFTDTLPVGLSYVTGTATIRGIFDVGISGSVYGALPAAATLIAPVISGQELQFNLGDMTNSDLPGDGNTEQVIIEFQAQVLNTADNNRTNSKTNTGYLHYLNRAGTQSNYNATNTVRIAEPNLTVTKTSNVTTARGGDTITFTVMVRNDNSVGADFEQAWELDLSDTLPADYSSLALISAVLTRGAANTNIITCGAVAGNTISLNLNCLAAANRYLNPGNYITIRYSAVLNPAIAFESVTTNTVNVSTTSLPGDYGTYPITGAPGNSDGERTGTGGVNDLSAAASASVTADKPTITKAVADDTLQILETTTTTLTIPLPVGQTSSFVVTDDLPAGLTYTGAAIAITIPAGVSASNSPNTTPGAGTDPLIFDFGTVQNTGPGVQNITIAYEVEVDNIAGNVRNTALTNTATLSYTGITLPAPSATATITVLEPSLSAVKLITAGAAGSNAGDTVSYQTTITNTDANATAYQVNLQDVLPAHLLGANGGAAPYFTNITVTNPGNAVVLNPGGVPVNATHAGFATTTLANDTLTWPLLDMPPGASIIISYDVVVTDDAVVGETLQNIVTAVYNSRSDGTGRDNSDNPLFDGTGPNNYGVRTTRDLTLDAAVAIQKILESSQPDDRFAIGEEITFDLRVDVLTGVTPDVTVTDVLPAGLEFVTGSVSFVADVHMSYTGPLTVTEAPAGTVTVELGDVANDPEIPNNPANDYFTIRLRALVLNDAANQNGVTLTDNGSVSADGGALNAGDALDVMVVEPVISLTKTAATTTPSLGDSVTYTVVVRHDPVIGTPPGSSADAHDIVLTDAIPAGLSYVPGSTSGPVIVDETDPVHPVFTMGGLTQAEISKSFSYRVTVDNSATVGVPLTNTLSGVFASIPGGNGDPDGGRNGEDGAGGLNNYVFSGTKDVTPTTPKFIRAPKTVAIAVDGGTAGQLDPGDTLEYTIVLTNSGSAAATNVVFTDVIPANTTYAGSLTTTQGSGGFAGNTVTVNVGPMASGASVTITFRVTVDALTPDGTTISNQGLVDSDQTVPRPTDDDDIDANGLNPTDIIVGPRPPLLNPLYAEKRVLWVADNDTSGDVTPGDRLNYTVIVENLGSTSLTGIALTDTIPGGLTYVGGTLIVTQEVPPNAAIAGQALTWPVGTLAPGAWAVAVFDVMIDDPLPGSVNTHTFTNQGAVTSNETTEVATDGNGNPSDGYQSTSITAVDGISGTPDLDVQKRYTVAVDANGDGFASPNDTLEYEIFITNPGAAPLNDVRIDTDPIPANTTLVAGSAYTSQGAVLDEDPITVNIGTVDPGDVITVRFRVTINAGTADGTIISNQANVTSADLPDELSDDNGDGGHDPTLTPVQTGGSGPGSPSNLIKDLVEADTSEPGSSLPSALIGEVLTYQVSVTVPEGLLRQAVLRDTLPAGLTYLGLGHAELARVFTTGLTSSTNPGTVNAASSGTFVPVTLSQSGQNLSLALGDVINSDSDVGLEGYVLRYDVIVANNGGNQAGTDNTNSATLTWQNALGAAQTLTPTSLPVTVTVAEPAIQMTLTADPPEISSGGGTISFTITITNPGGANVGPGYDLNITDILPAGFSNLVVAAVIPSGGVLAGDITDNSTSAGLDVIVAAFPVNGALTIVFTAESAPAGTLSSITNTARVEWTSLPGTNGTGNAAPGTPGAPTGERNWDGVDPPGTDNDYMTKDDAAVTYKPARRAIKFEYSCTACDTSCTADPQYVTVGSPSASLDPAHAAGTIEAWIQATSCTASDVDAPIVIKGAAAATCYGFGLAGGELFDEATPVGTSQNIGFRLGNDVLVADGKSLTPGKWYHVACAWDAAGLDATDHPDANPGDGMAIYINGVLENAGPVTAGGAPDTTGSPMLLGRQTITATPGQYFGVIEEFRVWHTTRTQTEIRENMCKILTLPDGNLACYFQYNEYGGAVATDASGNSNDADTQYVTQICSEAPVGDDSDSDYYDETGSYLLTMTAAGDTFTADDSGGTWDAASKSGMHIYRVDDAPEPSHGPAGSKLFGSRGYWGVFVTGGVDPTYSVTYTYNTAGIGDETGLDMMYRHQGCAPWVKLDATLNAGPPSYLSASGLEGTEFILGKNVDPRNAIEFDGVDDVVTVLDHGSLDASSAGTLEAWIYIDNHTAGGGIIHKGDNTDVTDEAYSLTLGAGVNTIVFTVRDGGGSNFVTSATTLNPDTWYHVAGVWDDGAANSMQIYINGVADGAPGVTRTARNSGGGLNIGQQFTVGAGSYAPFDGYIDEVRVWNTARTQVQIQATMCQKLAGTEANLQGYWRFDEEPTLLALLAVCPDYTTNNNNGSMSATFANFPSARVCSSAPIGDYSAYNYGGGASTVTLNPTGDPFRATATGGAWPGSAGIHVYRLDEAPVYGPDLWNILPTYPYIPTNGLTPPSNALPPPANWSSVDYYRYFGVFVTDPTGGLTYNVVYNYNGNPMTPDDDSVLSLARRDEFCDRSWADPAATLTVNLDTTANTITIVNDLQTVSPRQNPEYVLGGKDAPLAITLASFTATADNGCVEVAWETATEINTAGFHVWRSDNPLTGFIRVTSGIIPSTSEAETKGSTYSFQDCGVDFTGGKTYYYMLEEIEIDGEGKSNMHGPVGPVTETVSAVQDAAGGKGGNCFIDALWF